MAISTYQVFLMKDDAPLIDIKSFGDIGGAPETLETTTLSDPMTTSILGIQSFDAIEFDANYTPEKYALLKKQADDDMAIAETDQLPTYGVWFGANPTSKEPDGHNGKFSFKGRLSVHLTGGGVNEVVGMVITIAPAEPVTFEQASA